MVGVHFQTYQRTTGLLSSAPLKTEDGSRCANTGISDFIDPKGNFYLETEINEKANLIHEVGLINKKTFYTENGDVFPKAVFL
ncbi:MAG: hypothetical protein R3A12_06990 [Ignavibacteria bacterium]